MKEISFTEEDQKVLNDLGVSALVLFGSHAQGLAGPLSDFDFGVIFRLGHDLIEAEQRSKTYDALYDMLSSKIKRLVDIDIVFLRDTPMELQSHVAKDGIVLYERESGAFARFRERVLNIYADFAPLRKIFHDAILARIP